MYYNILSNNSQIITAKNALFQINILLVWERQGIYNVIGRCGFGGGRSAYVGGEGGGWSAGGGWSGVGEVNDSGADLIYLLLANALFSN